MGHHHALVTVGRCRKILVTMVMTLNLNLNLTPHLHRQRPRLWRHRHRQSKHRHRQWRHRLHLWQHLRLLQASARPPGGSVEVLIILVQHAAPLAVRVMSFISGTPSVFLRGACDLSRRLNRHQKKVQRRLSMYDRLRCLQGATARHKLLAALRLDSTDAPGVQIPQAQRQTVGVLAPPQMRYMLGSVN